MAASSLPAVRRRSRRSARGEPTDVPQLQDDLLAAVPTDIPAHERLRGLLKQCFKRAVEKLSDESEDFEDFFRGTLTECLQLFDDTGEGDSLTLLLKAATAPTPANKSAVEAVLEGQVKSLSAECKRWNELLADNSLAEEEQCMNSTAEMPLDQQAYYDAMIRKADQSRRAAFQYASAIQTMLGKRDPEAGGRADINSGEVDDDESILDV